jgi:hypothetical protein
MADKKITDLLQIVTIANNDVLPIVDISDDITKKIDIAQLKALAPVQSVNGKNGALSVDKTDVGLGNCDNTTDANKPISSATQTALDGKQATLVSGTNIKTINSTSILGSGNISISSAVAWGGITGTLSSQTDLQTALDLKVDENSAITGATKTKITYDAKGLVTAGADATTADIADSTNKRYVTDAQLTIVGNTSGTNTGDNATNSQYSGLAASKQDTLVSATNIKTINSTTLLGSGNIAVEPTIAATTSADYYRGDKTFATLNKTAVALGNVDNTSDANKPVSTAQQTALDLKTNKLIVANRQTASYTLVLSDADKLVEMNVASANNLTIPLNSSVAFATGTQILLAQYGAGQTTIVLTSGVTLRSNASKVKLNAQYSGATLIKIDTNEWYLFGDIA